MTQTAFITANDLVLHVNAMPVIQGATPIIFVNSLGSDLRIWDGVVECMEGNYRLVRYDKRGHGLSDCPDAPYSIRDHTLDLQGLMDALDIDKAVLIGISVGGMIAMDFASQYPARVQALVLCDTFPKIGTDDMWNRRVKMIRQYGMKSLSAAILERWFAPAYKDQQPEAYAGYGNMLHRMPVAGYTGTCEAIRDADLTDAVRKIQQKTLVLCGTEDASTPPEQVKQLVDLMPDARYAEIPSAGHLPCIENPQLMAHTIQEFLSEVI